MKANNPNKKSSQNISLSEITNPNAIAQIQHFRKKEISTSELVNGILNQNRTALSRAITLIESTHPTHIEKANSIIKSCLPHVNQSVRIGITGIPGVGKSTFIEALGIHLTSLGKKVAVLAVDPSSALSSGSILGDKTRMEELAQDANAFIRPSPSGSNLGGVARKTRETIILCEATGFDTIIIETVGVGQSEIAVHRMVDFFLLLQITGAGDDLQGIKRGIMEMADAVIINKADGENSQNAQVLQAAIQKTISLFPKKDSEWVPFVSCCSALHKEGITEIWQTLTSYFETIKKNHFFEENRKNQNLDWMYETINDELLHQFYNQPAIITQLEINKKAVQNNEKSPFEAALELIRIYKK
ncbi:methylmalonyl Co-A mutase-associated GTPase MeaB [Flavobacterium agrisoli]|uniref:methylmalonyl Co-A mutase-associated GTPase MeaB n=1 Tax=Flavobacterium agrisoli TaxID=2793066 RepID=UPI001F204D39|nr:methylmalonyl Co-A mutase-associated GTPase MeaB [Flavobacterium agrisoli]